MLIVKFVVEALALKDLVPEPQNSMLFKRDVPVIVPPNVWAEEEVA